MRYRVALVKRIDSEGHESSLEPSLDIDTLMPEGVVAEKVFVEHLESDAEHSEEILDEDDAFLGSATPEVWEYEVVNERAAEFEDALKRSHRVLEFEKIDEEPTEASEVTEELDNDSARTATSEAEEAEAPVTRHGSGVRSGDDGPAGRPSAGGLSVGRADISPLDPGEPVVPGPDQIDDLNIVQARDRRLGLTNRRQKPPQDWAANTGETRNPDGGIDQEALGKRESTLSPRGRR